MKKLTKVKEVVNVPVKVKRKKVEKRSDSTMKRRNKLLLSEVTNRDVHCVSSSILFVCHYSKHIAKLVTLATVTEYMLLVDVSSLIPRLSPYCMQAMESWAGPGNKANN